MNKKQLALKLSELKEFTKGKIHLEQYPTSPEIAADMLWDIHMLNDIKNKTIADLGCGHGIIGIGALILGAKKVYFVDIDKDLIEIAKENLKDFKKENFEILNKNIQYIKLKTDIVIQNPPFGVKQKHNDLFFLSKAMHIAPKIYSLHKTSTRKFIEKFCKDNNYKSKLLKQYQFPLKKSMLFHVKKIKYVDVDFWQMTKSL